MSFSVRASQNYGDADAGCDEHDVEIVTESNAKSDDVGNVVEDVAKDADDVEEKEGEPERQIDEQGTF